MYQLARADTHDVSKAREFELESTEYLQKIMVCRRYKRPNTLLPGTKNKIILRSI